MKAVFSLRQFPRMRGGQWFATLLVWERGNFAPLMYSAKGETPGQARTAVMAHAVLRLGWGFKG